MARYENFMFIGDFDVFDVRWREIKKASILWRPRRCIRRHNRNNSGRWGFVYGKEQTKRMYARSTAYEIGLTKRIASK